MTRPYNFNPGPATLPEEVLLQAQSELLNWQNTGVSVMEISHHSPEFKQLVATTEADLRELLAIPDNYKILFMQGGGRSQFAMTPLNLLGDKTTADYIETGIWSTMALKEAQRYCAARSVASSAAEGYTTIPTRATWQCNEDAAYFFYVDNETIGGVEFPEPPDVHHAPLVSDMSSSILSRPIDVSRLGLIFAAAQKNAGPAGITLVIIREDLLDKALPITPTMFNYSVHAKANSLYHTPPTFTWYVTGLVLKWVKQQGGVAEMAARNQQKATKLYNYIDSTGFYRNTVEKAYRSRMNVVFHLADETLNDQFLQQARAADLVGLKGHSTVGGMRASIYNPMPEAGIDALIAFMSEFEKQFG